MNQKKIIIFLNILLLIILLYHLLDFFSTLRYNNYSWIYNNEKSPKIFIYIKNYNRYHSYKVKFDEKKAAGEILSIKHQEKNHIFNEHLLRPIENKKANKSILILGGSTAHGWSLHDNQTLSYNLGQLLSNYRIYNKAKCGWTTSHMLYQLENKDFSDIPDVKLVIFIFRYFSFMHDYFNDQHNITPYYNKETVNLEKYTLKNMEIPLLKYFINKYVAMKMFYVNIKDNKKVNREKSKIELTQKLIEKSKKESELKFGKDVKFIIFRYDKGEDEPYNYMFEELKKRGFIVVSLSDLSPKDYNIERYQIPKTKGHPNALAWQEITPLFVKYLQDRGYLKE